MSDSYTVPGADSAPLAIFLSKLWNLILERIVYAELFKTFDKQLFIEFKPNEN